MYRSESWGLVGGSSFLVGGKIGSKYLGVEIPAPTLVVGIAFRRAGVVVDELA